MSENILVSLIIPCRNEAATIGIVLKNILSQDFPTDNLEIFVVDGESIDRTCEIVSSFRDQFSNLLLLDNPERTVPFALNKAITMAKGNYIIRLDAHSNYATDYISKIVETFETTGADIVGGPMRAKGTSNIQSAIAYCTSTKMGVGNSAFHDENFKGWVDSVYLGAWKKELFKDVGLFDTQMKRNQDDEFHYRAKSKGKKIYLNPEIKSLYYPRDSFNKLFKQYFQYGLYKPLVLRKVHSGAQLRHVIPKACNK